MPDPENTGPNPDPDIAEALAEAVQTEPIPLTAGVGGAAPPAEPPAETGFVRMQAPNRAAADAAVQRHGARDIGGDDTLDVPVQEAARLERGGFKRSE